MPDEVITAPVQNSGGARAAAVFLSARVLQIDNFSDDFRNDFKKRGRHPSRRGAQSSLRRLRTLVCVAAPQDEELSPPRGEERGVTRVPNHEAPWMPDDDVSQPKGDLEYPCCLSSNNS
jgi:hypothetical protein